MLFSAKVGQEIRPMNELSDRRIEDLPIHGKVGWGGGEKFFFRRDVIAMMVKARGDERGNACSFIRKLPQGDRNDWLLKERLD